MAAPVSALSFSPYELVREVSPETIIFYTGDLSGIYLPSDFVAEHAQTYDVKYWKPEDRLCGKFGRFTVKAAEVAYEKEPLEDILVMGTTIGVRGLDRYQSMHSLRHHELSYGVRGVLGQRGLLGRHVEIDDADYGSTTIKMDGDGSVEAVSVGGASLDYGRATAEGRQVTCDLFAKLLGEEIKIINANPEPREREQIVSTTT